MDNNVKHIDEILRDKFEDFSPTPPKHIWAGIEMGLTTKPIIPFYKKKVVIATTALIFLAIITSFVIINPMSFNNYESNSLQNTIIDENELLLTDSKVDFPENEEAKEVFSDDNIGELVATNNLIIEQPEENNQVTNIVVDAFDIPVTQHEKSSEIKALVLVQNNNETVSDHQVGVIKMKQSVFVCPELYNFSYIPEKSNFQQSFSGLTPSKPEKISTSHWKVGSYISPELSLSELDSVQILNSYTLSVEPTYFINDHWFFRFGVGFSYVRDRGFAKLDYITNDYIGSYDDVYDITFDTIAGQVTPTYHTKSVEIWDSIHHVTISNVTNKYVYLQLPALFGYYSKKSSSHIGWYVMGGPVFNIKTGSWIDNPIPPANDADVISLQNNLPTRANTYFQLWLGAGIEYEVNSKISIAVEPGYRYYFRSIYDSPYGATSSSGLTLRVGLIYLMK